jgi:DNA repair protein RecO (recombination protein O)
MSFYKQATGYIIHQRKFKNTSQIIEFFSQEFGKFQLVAKGINKNKNLLSQLQPFSLAKIQFYGSSDLKNLVSLNLLENIIFDDLLLNTSALYLNELIHLSVLEHESPNQLFQFYQQALVSLGKLKLSQVLRQFEWQLLKHNGFEIAVEAELDQDNWVSINENHGMVIHPTKQSGLCKISDLRMFVENKLTDRKSQKRFNKFMGQAISICVSHRKIFSKELIKSIIKLT